MDKVDQVVGPTGTPVRTDYAIVPQEEACREFFKMLWGDLELEVPHRILVWLKCLSGEKRSLWAETPDEAARLARENANSADVYVGCALRPPGLGERRRGDKQECVAVPGICADLDFGEGHKKPVLRDEDAALKFIDDGELKPTVVVHSGHGFQLWWLLARLVLLESQGDRDFFETVAQGWIRHLSELAGVTLDQVGDLPRVMRIPGTLNHKLDPTVPVRLVRRDGPTYADLEEFRGRVGNPSGDSRRPPPKKRASTNVASLIVAADRSPPAEKLDLLIENHDDFPATWRRERPDLRDQSPSGYCMSLAMVAMHAGWSDQHVVDLCLAWRRKHGENLKRDDDPDWYTRGLLVPARKKIEERRADPEGTSREEALERLRWALRLEDLERVVKLGREAADPFEFRFADGQSVGFTDVTSQPKVRRALAHGVQRVAPRFKGEQWDHQVVAAILAAAELLETQTENEETESWLETLVEDVRPEDLGDDRFRACVNLKRYGAARDDRTLYLCLRPFAHHLKRDLGAHASTRDLARRLKRLGYSPVQISARRHGTSEKIDVRAWMSPTPPPAGCSGVTI